jgi:ribonuclease HII
MTGPKLHPALELDLLSSGIDLVAGVDEVGRGALAGPICAGAVLLDRRLLIDRDQLDGVTDSKLVPAGRRPNLNARVWRLAPVVALGWAEAADIDQLGVVAATRKAMISALTQLRPRPQALISDAVSLDGPAVPETFIAIPRADSSCLSVAAASICAKVARDAHMRRLDGRFDAYGFASNVGYGTRRHLQALANHGPSTEHRLSFAPCQRQLKLDRQDWA